MTAPPVPTAGIRVRVGQSDSDVIEVPTSDVYFAFASGRLSYDCLTCGARCCRGFGFLTGSADQRLAAAGRVLPLFVAPAGMGASAGSMVHNFAPACFFLEGDGRCRIHVEEGYAAKPETCRLFPFNFIRRCGHRLIVAPHPYLCPLMVTLGGDRSTHSDHEGLLRDMASQGIMSGVGSAECVADQDDRVFALEEETVRASEGFLDGANYITFVEEQVRLSERLGEASSASGNIAYALTLAECLFNVPSGTIEAPDHQLTRVMVGATPYLRTQFVFPDPDDRVRHTRLTLQHVPMAMFWIFVYGTAARQSGMQEITFQTLSKITSDFAPVIRMMSLSSEVVWWQRGTSLDIARVHNRSMRELLIRVSRALLPAVQARAGLPLGEILRQHAPANVYARAAFLREVARHTAGKIAFAGSVASKSVLALRNRLGGAVERWLLRQADDDLAREFYDLVSRRQRKRSPN